MSQYNYKDIIEMQLPQDMYKSKDLESQAIGDSLDKLQYDVDKLENDVNPLTAINKGLERWEDFFKLPSNIRESIEIRRARVVSELIQFMSDENVIRKDEMESIISLYSDECNVTENFAEYVFNVTLRITGENHYSLNLLDIHYVIKKVKPSWLNYNLLLNLKPNGSNIYIGSALIIGEEITVYPWRPKEIELRTTVNIGIGHNTGVEDVTVYPKGVI